MARLAYVECFNKDGNLKMKKSVLLLGSVIALMVSIQTCNAMKPVTGMSLLGSDFNSNPRFSFLPSSLLSNGSDGFENIANTKGKREQKTYEPEENLNRKKRGRESSSSSPFGESDSEGEEETNKKLETHEHDDTVHSHLSIGQRKKKIIRIRMRKGEEIKKKRWFAFTSSSSSSSQSNAPSYHIFGQSK
jgi:hypothetical protein